MRRNSARTLLTLTAVAIVTLGLAATSANADVVLEEQFDYDAGVNLDTQDGGTGFDGPWVSTISHGRIFEVQPTGLSHSTRVMPPARTCCPAPGLTMAGLITRMVSVATK